MPSEEDKQAARTRLEGRLDWALERLSTRIEVSTSEKDWFQSHWLKLPLQTEKILDQRTDPDTKLVHLLNLVLSDGNGWSCSGNQIERFCAVFPLTLKLSHCERCGKDLPEASMKNHNVCWACY